MAFASIASTTTAGNGVYVSALTVTDGFAIIGSIQAYDSAGGTLTMAIVRNDKTTRVIVVKAIGAGATVSFTNGATDALTPLILKAGEILQVQANSTTMAVTISGLTIT